MDHDRRPIVPTRLSARKVWRIVVEVAIVLGALWLARLAWRVDVTWVERNCLPYYCARNPEELSFVSLVRWTAALAAAITILALRPLVGRWASRGSVPSGLAILTSSAAAVILALLVSEARLQAKAPPFDLNLTLRQFHPRYGFTWTPSTTLLQVLRGQRITYAVNARSERARTIDDVPDLKRPTILFAGESFMFGSNLTYEQTIPALIEARMGVQTVNVAVPAYGTDQAYLRAIDTLAELQRPLAVVTSFMPFMVSRVAEDYKMRLVVDDHGELQLIPTASVWWWSSILRWKWHRLYHGDLALRTAAAVVRATAERARARGAATLFVVTDYGPPCLRGRESAGSLVRTLFDDQKIPYVYVPNDPEWAAIPTERPYHHPDARWAQAVAPKVEAELRRLLPPEGLRELR
jgi:hypothetical protein